MSHRTALLVDRAAHAIIAVGGIAIIAAVLGIGLFLVAEIVPLLRGARITPQPSRAVLPVGQVAHLVVLDEHQEKVAVLGAAPALRIITLADDMPPEELPLPGLEGQLITAATRQWHDTRVAVGSDQGRLWIGSMELQPVYVKSQRSIRAAVAPELVFDAAPGLPLTQVAFRPLDEHVLVAAIVDQAHVAVARVTPHGAVLGTHMDAPQIAVPLGEAGRPTVLALNEQGTQLLVGTDQGTVLRWRLPAEGTAQLLETVLAVPHGAVTAMTYLLGYRSVAIGGSDGSLATWSPVNREGHADGWQLTRIHAFPAQGGAVTAIAPSPRDKGFIAATENGVARLHHMTSERTLAAFPLRAASQAMDFAPKANGAAFVDAAGQLHRWHIHNPHPEVSWKVLFGKVWYEGYPEPDYIWQSTGGTDDFESKLSLVPLLFGTMKGTWYALLFAVPVALFGALYCSQFLDKRWRNPIKSCVELMAALPSVVLGFIAGVVLAPLVQEHIVAALSLPVILPLVVLCGMLLCTIGMPVRWRGSMKHQEFVWLVWWLVVGVVAALALGPWLERALFRGDFQAWLLTAAGTRYDQRNALVVGWVMGFAVIPIIFTICEDAFSSVPRHLVAASLACGASPWQTAWRVVLPAAGSGVFSAIMVGFGRAIGETMIVLMATGNTPVMQWTMFNGFRTLSANIAVEIPEAPHGGTLYRVLFLAALLLFGLAFCVNTAAEVIRLRLRHQLRGL